MKPIRLGPLTEVEPLINLILDQKIKMGLTIGVEDSEIPIRGIKMVMPTEINQLRKGVCYAE
jgi:hypothetical protein